MGNCVGLKSNSNSTLEEAEGHHHALDPKHVNHCFSTNELRVHGGENGPLLAVPSSASRHQPNGILPALSTAASGMQSWSAASWAGPLHFLLWGFHGHLHRLLYPLKPSSLPPPPPPDRPCSQQPPVRDSHFSGRHLRHS